MEMAKAFLLGVLATIGAMVIGTYVVIVLGLFPANADTRPSKFEFWAARQSLHATLAREAPTTPNPMPLNEANLLAGLKLYAQNCAVCHGTARGKASLTNIAKGLYQKAPPFATRGVEDDPDGVIYWKIKHGIRLTGMPAFGRTLSDSQLLQLTLFLKHMNRLPAKVQQKWKGTKLAENS